MKTRFAVLALAALWCSIATARPGEDNPVILTVAPLDTVPAAAGDTVMVSVPLKITPGYHVNANPASSEDYIPLAVQFDSSAFLHPLKPDYPQGLSHRIEELDETLLVYDNGVTIKVPVVIDKNTQAGTYPLKGIVEFQACDDHVCFMPEARPLRAVIVIP